METYFNCAFAWEPIQKKNKQLTFECDTDEVLRTDFSKLGPESFDWDPAIFPEEISFSVSVKESNEIESAVREIFGLPKPEIREQKYVYESITRCPKILPEIRRRDRFNYHYCQDGCPGHQAVVIVRTGHKHVHHWVEPHYRWRKGNREHVSGHYRISK